MNSEAEKRPIIAWVDDDRDLQSLARGWLIARYDLATYANGADFIDDLDELRPELVILDVRMPGPDGFAICRTLRAHPGFAAVPVLFLTASHDDGDFLKNIEAGGTAYLEKPFDKKELLSTIREMLQPVGTSPMRG